MNYSIVTIPPFDRQFKRLAKKHPSLSSDLARLGDQLAENPTMGTSIGQDCYKIRVAISSSHKGKSGGARVITYVYYTSSTVFLMAIYEKSVKINISNKEINELLKFI